MQWNQGRRGGNLEDRRGLGPGHFAAGGGIGALVLAAVGYFVFGISPDQTLQAVNAVQGQQTQQ